jgi:hypothetical protein
MRDMNIKIFQEGGGRKNLTAEGLVAPEIHGR